MALIEQDKNKIYDHFRLRCLLQEAKHDMFTRSVYQRKKWVTEDPLAKEILAILVKHPLYYDEFKALVGGIFPRPAARSLAISRSLSQG